VNVSAAPARMAASVFMALFSLPKTATKRVNRS
jgi:hypothetical protein